MTALATRLADRLVDALITAWVRSECAATGHEPIDRGGDVECEACGKRLG